MDTVQDSKKHVIVVGGGFAGLNLIRVLFNSPYYRVTLIDKNNYNYFTPLLYQVATNFLEPSSISYPFRKLFRNKGVAFQMAEVLRLDTVSQLIELSDGKSLTYDYLIFAAGTRTNFFGNDHIRKQAFSIKGIDDALYLRNELVKTMEMAQIETDPEERRRLMSIVIAGGGPTGVELAGMLAEMKKDILKKDYPDLDPLKASIHIINNAPFLLAPMSEKSHQGAYDLLEKLGVQIRLKLMVTGYEEGKVFLSDNTVIEARTLIWATGVIGNTFDGLDKNAVGRGNRMLTDAYGLVQGYNNIYAVGDIALHLSDEAYPNGYPQLAQPAIQQGKSLGKNLIRLARQQPMKKFSYHDRGEMAIVGRKAAMADLFKHRLHINGIAGLLTWLVIHLISLVNYNNIVKTLYSWIVAYLTNDQALRMIFRSEKKEVSE